MMLTFSLYVHDFCFCVFHNEFQTQRVLTLPSCLKPMITCMCVCTLVCYFRDELCITLYSYGFCFFHFPEFPSLIIEPAQESFSPVSMLHLVILFTMMMHCLFYADDILIYLFRWTFLQQFQSCQAGRLRLKTRKPSISTTKCIQTPEPARDPSLI